MNSYLQTVRTTIFTTLGVTLTLSLMNYIHVSSRHLAQLEKEKALLSRIANDEKLTDDFKKEFFNSFMEKYSSADDGHEFNIILVESLVDTISKTEQEN